ncbi:hypothetical protein [Streptomyces chartreusis]|uniref:hypothetical protein n=1 Tax=Streptomyces chartreusis TaxID=1969 RepID=UPI0033DDC4FD
MSDTTGPQVTADPADSPQGKWMRHCVPEVGQNCPECLATPNPREGCEEGSRLYAEWIDTRRMMAREEKQDQ